MGRSLALGVLLLVVTSSPAKSQQPSAAPRAKPAPSETKAAHALAALRAWVEKKGGVLSGEVRDLDTGETLARENAARALNPASAQKVLTAAMALDLLGPDYEFQTGLFGELEGDHVGDLVLRGQGDPSLAYSDLARLAAAVAALGLKEVRGRLLVDQSRFDDHFVPPAFDQQPKEWAAFRAPISAVSIDENAVTMNVMPTRDGQPARVWFTPPGVVKASGEVATRAVGSGQGVEWELTPKGQSLKSTVGGYVSQGQPRLRFVRRMADPRLGPGLALAYALRREGIKIDRDVGLGGAEQKTRLAYVASAPLSILLHRLGKYSDNFYAETIFKGLATQAAEPPASSAGAARRMMRWLEDQKIDDKSIRILNGSGLFDANRLTADCLVAVLGKAYQNPAIRSEYVSQLSIGGVDGTLSARFRDARCRSRVRAKTGTLNDVDALVGYVLRPSGRAPIAFAVLVNGIHRQHVQVRAHIDQAVIALVNDE